MGLCVLPNVNINNKFFNAFEWGFIEMKKTTKSLHLVFYQFRQEYSIYSGNEIEC